VAVDRSVIDHLTSHHWCIIHRYSPLQALALKLWERCRASLSELTSQEWSGLHIEGRGKASQQRDLDTVPRLQALKEEAEALLEAILRQIAADKMPAENLRRRCCTQ
jgi:hypothetical protein